MSVLAVSGPDGAGKSTFARALESELRIRYPEMQISRLWLRWNPRVGEKGVPRSTSTVDLHHRGHPAKHVLRAVGLSSVWVSLATAQYRRQLLLQMSSLPPQSVIIADRFVLDFCADLVAGGMLSIDRVRSVVDRLPRADVSVLLMVPDDVLAERRKPNDDLELLLARAANYRQLADLVGATVLDGRNGDAINTALSLFGKKPENQ